MAIRRYEFYKGKESKERLDSNDVLKVIRSIPVEELETYGFSVEERGDSLRLIGRHTPRAGGFSSCVIGGFSDNELRMSTNEDCVTVSRYISNLSQLLNHKGLNTSLIERI
ncbi:MAG: hypothetical protein AABW51_00090 [Nanoarchaeota archaeon]